MANTYNIERIYTEAKRLAELRGHAPDLTDLDAIVEDAIQLAHEKCITTEDVFNALNILIAKGGLSCTSDCIH
jgi:predicted ATP-dependent protease